jgi:hypothetical protein
MAYVGGKPFSRRETKEMEEVGKRLKPNTGNHVQLKKRPVKSGTFFLLLLLLFNSRSCRPPEAAPSDNENKLDRIII